MYDIAFNNLFIEDRSGQLECVGVCLSRTGYLPSAVDQHLIYTPRLFIIHFYLLNEGKSSRLYVHLQ